MSVLYHVYLLLQNQQHVKESQNHSVLKGGCSVMLSLKRNFNYFVLQMEDGGVQHARAQLQRFPMHTCVSVGK